MSKKQFNNGLYYSTNFALELNTNSEEHKSLDFNKQVNISTLKLKNNKVITLISNIDSTDEDLNRIAKIIKCNCGTGGSVKNREIIIQGDFLEKVFNVIKKLGFVNINK